MFALAGVSGLLFAIACETPTTVPTSPDFRSDLSAWFDESDDGSMPESRLSADDVDAPLTTGIGAPSGELVIEDDDLMVGVGEEVLLTFSAELWDVDPDDAYFVISGAPEGAEIDPVAGIFYWVPTIDDLGVHVIGVDLRCQGDNRVLDAQRVTIEVIPTESLIEVGI